MLMLHYWLSVVERAFGDSLRAIGYTPVTILFAIAVVGSTAFLAWKKERKEKEGWRVFIKRRLLRDLLAVVPIAIIAWSPFFLWFLISDPAQMQQESARHEQNLQGQIRGVSEQLTTCITNIGQEQDKLRLLEDQNRAQQTTISGQQTTLTAQQQTMNSQQGTLNSMVGSCIAALNANNVNLPPEMNLINGMALNPDITVAKHAHLLLVLTNKSVTPINAIFTCDKPLAKVDAWVAGTGMRSGGVGRDKTYFRFPFPLRQWLLNLLFY
jgi:hypothetical protein